MKIVLLEPLGVPQHTLDRLIKPLLEAGHSFTAYPRDTDPRRQLERARDADVILLANLPLPASVIEQCPRLKFIDIAFTGVDHVAVAAAKQRGIQISNAAGYSTQAVAELSLGLMLSLLRRVPQLEQRCRTGGTKEGLVGCELAGKTVGIVGAGAIGLRTARLCAAFGCRVLGCKRHVTGDEPDFIELVSLERLLTESDIVSLHCPLNDSTRHLIDAERIARMKPGAYLINTARGGVVDAQALADALNEGRLGGAGIDVFDDEPPLGAQEPLLHCQNTLVTPHAAFATAESMEQRAQIVFDNLYAWLRGEQKNII